MFMFSINHKETFPSREERILQFWQKNEIFEKSIEQTSKKPLFTFYDGPPFATGLPHYGHILAGTIKDVVPRFWTMQGFYVPRRFGWDCHGLPVENEIQKSKNLLTSFAIEDFGLANFNEECRSIVLRYTQQWEKTVTRMGRWVNFQNPYKTMDAPFMESVWWVFGELWKKGLIYEGYKVMPFSTNLGTPLSNFEANLNYKEVNDPSLTITFPLIGEEDVSFLAWTTTPWTLPSNLALAVHPEATYVKIFDKKTEKKYILAEERVKHHFQDFEVVAAFKGNSLKNKPYKPLFPYFTNKKNEGAFRVLTDDFVSMEDGTGIVHMAPAFGETDFALCQKEGIEAVCPIDQNGFFTDLVPDYQGVFVKDADKEIIKHLKTIQRVYSHSQIHHRYPFCWRSDTPLIYKAVKTWFVAVEKLKDRLLEANEEITWVPHHIKEGRFGNWLKNARDWAISRNRYWGTPIPIWQSEDGEIHVISSVQELEEKTGKKITDLHRHFIDDLTFQINGKTFSRIKEVFDCWFESGSMPYAQNHFPFETKEKTLESFPANFIAEGIDQTRCWFYTLHVLSVALFNKPAFRNVIVNGIVLAEDGMKMSKRLKNYPEPKIVIEQFGADALRLYLMNSPVIEGCDLRFCAKEVELVLRQALIPLWNCYVFLATYAKIHNWTPPKNEEAPSPIDIDKWILSLLHKLIHEVTEAMFSYKLQTAVIPIVHFIDHLTDWYIRRNRPRFWNKIPGQGCPSAFNTLYTVLHTLSRLTAPFIPFLSDAIYKELKKEADPISVHLCSFPPYNPDLRDYPLEEAMQIVQMVVNMGHNLRKEHKIKVRQPLAKADIVCNDAKKLENLQRHSNLIAEELNVKTLSFHENENNFVSLEIKPNFRILGKKVGRFMKAAQNKIENLSSTEILQLLEKKTITLQIEETPLVIEPEDVTIERKSKPNIVASSYLDITIALDTTLSHDLILEGIARELVNKINATRREIEVHLTDLIDIKIQTTPTAKEAFEKHCDYICNETLINNFSLENCKGKSWDINGHETVLAIQKFSP
jgi:isoleucyl-tRNA synthetase